MTGFACLGVVSSIARRPHKSTGGPVLSSELAPFAGRCPYAFPSRRDGSCLPSPRTAFSAQQAGVPGQDLLQDRQAWDTGRLRLHKYEVQKQKATFKP